MIVNFNLKSVLQFLTMWKLWKGCDNDDDHNYIYNYTIDDDDDDDDDEDCSSSPLMTGCKRGSLVAHVTRLRKASNPRAINVQRTGNDQVLANETTIHAIIHATHATTCATIHTTIFSMWTIIHATNYINSLLLSSSWEQFHLECF